MKEIRLLLVGHSQIALCGMESMLKGQKNIVIVGKSTNPSSAILLAEASQPDVVVVCLSGTFDDGTESTNNRAVFSVIHALLTGQSKPSVLVMSVSNSPYWLVEALKAGACGLVSQDISSTELVRAIFLLGQGMTALTKSQVIQLSHALIARDIGLTAREFEVLRLVADDYSNKEIAVILQLSVGTVRIHVQNIRHKMMATNRRQAVAEAKRRGII